MLKDKDIARAIEVMRSAVDLWYPATLEDGRALANDELRSALSGLTIVDAGQGQTPRACYRAAVQASVPGDRVVVFGSFYLVGDILAAHSDWAPG
jgi:dihydrofolate synthase/folylpolyglutamate synthase